MSDTTPTDIIVSLKYGDLDEVILWCADNCNSKWDLAEIAEFGGNSNGIYHFNFHEDSDAVLFSLRWS